MVQMIYSEKGHHKHHKHRQGERDNHHYRKCSEERHKCWRHRHMGHG